MNILGVDVAVTNMQRTTNYIIKNAGKLRGQYITLTNVHTTVTAHEDEEYRNIQNEAFLALPDGKPIALALRLKGHKKARQVAGPDLMNKIWQMTENTNLTHYFYGGSQETIDKLREVLNEKYPNLKIAGMESPPFRPLLEEEDKEAIERINSANADFVWVGLGAPKQEIWMYNHKDKVNALMLGVGAAFDFHAGTVKRAPKWMQKCYLEWFYRLLQDPKRLWKRYVVTNTKFIYYMFK